MNCFSTRIYLTLSLFLLAPARAQNVPLADASPLVLITNADETATDDLGRTLPSFAQTGPPKANRHVGLFYWQWHGNNRWLPNGQYDLTKFLKSRPYFKDFTANPPGGPNNPTFYWAQPVFGYYRSTDPYVIRKHLVMLADSGVDFLFLDYTNSGVYDAELQVFLDVARELKNTGLNVPKLTFFLNHEPDWKTYALYQKWYLNPQYSDMWFRWRGKPLLMAPIPLDAAKLRAGQNAALLPAIRDYFTFRPTWAFHSKEKEPTKWRFMHGYNAPVANDPEGRPEQLVVNKSTGGPIWDNLKNGGVSAVEGKTYQETDYAPDWTLKDADKGIFFQNGWKRAREIAAPMLLVTGWNEWTASVWNTPNVVMLGRKTVEGQGHIVDEFNTQFNRDIEPMRGGTRDNYYWQFVANMRLYKGMAAPQKVSDPRAIAIDGAFEDWKGVTPRYVDAPNDTSNRDFAATVPEIRYLNTSARNDIALSQVARGAHRVAFHVQTAAPLSPPTGTNWMNLLIDADNNAKTGWNGYDLLVNRTRSGQKCSIERAVGKDWKWRAAGMAPFAVLGRDIEIALPRTLFGPSALQFSFKWADNLPAVPAIEDFYTQGDVAPDTRFNALFQEVPRKSS